MTEVVGADGCWAAMVCIADVAAVAGSYGEDSFWRTVVVVVACGAVVAEEDATMTSSISSASAASMI